MFVLAGLAAGPVSAGEVERGRALFTHAWTPRDPRSRAGDGLGPVFNATSCVACHDKGGPGGAGGTDRNIEIITAIDSFNPTGGGFFYAFAMDFGAGRFEYRIGDPSSASNRTPSRIDPALAGAVHPGFRRASSLMLHRFGTDPTYQSWRESVPGNHGRVVVQTSERNPTPLFGLGRIDAIPDSVIEAAAKPKVSAGTRIKGRIGRTEDGRVGRFGWKAQTATLAEFVHSAAANEVGLEVPGHHQGADPRLPGLEAPGLDLDQADCEALVAFVRALPAPVTLPPADAKGAAQVKGGESTFKAIGCAACHLPKLGDVAGLYSDLLLHDMSPRLADTGTYGVFVAGAADAPAPRNPGLDGPATVGEWRTPPLWGLRDSAPYLHDGRASTVAEAIALHGGEGSASASRFAQLSPRRRQQLESFLMSLAAPGQAN
jgi:CxxC motif-containing protein (DUF1111 family)